MFETEELDEKLYTKIVALCKEGDAFTDTDHLSLALKKYQDALLLLPVPISKWKAATWILTAIGDTLFAMKDYPEALNYLKECMYCPDAIGNPFIHLRLGQVQYELGNLERAKDELARAYMGDGDEIFADEDPKYFQLVKSVLQM